MAHFLINKSVNNQYYWSLKSDNHEIILTSSEQYISKSGAETSINTCKILCELNNFHIAQASNMQYFFVQKANNHLTIAKSEFYTTKDNCEKGIHAVIRLAPSANIVDGTVSAKSYY